MFDGHFRNTIWKCNITLQNGQLFTKLENLKQEEDENEETDSNDYYEDYDENAMRLKGMKTLSCC